MEEAVLIYTTWPDAETALAAAEAAVTAHAAACANVMAPIASIYRWEGAVERGVETPVLFKTAAPEALRALVLELHPYELPCFVALGIDAARSHPAYLAWLRAESGTPPPPVGEGG